jgi:hypothetical protein
MRFVINKARKIYQKNRFIAVLSSCFVLIFLYLAFFHGFNLTGGGDSRYGGGLVGEFKKIRAEQMEQKHQEALRQEFARKKIELATQKLAAQRQFKRVAFFPTSKMGGSVAVPIDWQLFYLTKELKGQVDFIYQDEATSTRLMSLRIVDPLTWPAEAKAQPDWRIITKEKTAWFLFNLPVVKFEGTPKKTNQRLKKMLSDRELVISSFKSLKAK